MWSKTEIGFVPAEKGKKMAEYIEREAAYKSCGWYNLVNGKSVCGVQKYEIAAIPAADVYHMVHGEWEEIKHSAYDSTWGDDVIWFMYACSSCGGEAVSNFPHCPFCGAKMDGERKGDDGT